MRRNTETECFKYWSNSLSKPGMVNEFQNHLVERWEKNAPLLAPSSLPTDIDQMNIDGDWSTSLEHFLLSDFCSEDETHILLDSFTNALSTLNPNIKTGSTWFRDVLALRRAKTDNAVHISKILELLISSASQLVDKYPAPDIESYSYFSELYEILLTAIVDECYDGATLNQKIRLGLRSVAPHAFSQIRELEAVRYQKLLKTEKYKALIGSNYSNFELYNTSSNVYHTLICQLSDALFKLNARSMMSRDDKNYLQEFSVFLNSNLSPINLLTNNWIPQHQTLARLLDIHWLKLLQLLPSVKYANRETQINYIKQLSGDNSSINNSIFRFENLETLAPPTSLITTPDDPIILLPISDDSMPKLYLPLNDIQINAVNDSCGEDTTGPAYEAMEAMEAYD